MTIEAKATFRKPVYAAMAFAEIKGLRDRMYQEHSHFDLQTDGEKTTYMTKDIALTSVRDIPQQEFDFRIRARIADKLVAFLSEQKADETFLRLTNLVDATLLHPIPSKLIRESQRAIEKFIPYQINTRRPKLQ